MRLAVYWQERQLAVSFDQLLSDFRHPVITEGYCDQQTKDKAAPSGTHATGASSFVLRVVLTVMNLPLLGLLTCPVSTSKIKSQLRTDCDSVHSVIVRPLCRTHLKIHRHRFNQHYAPYV